jgi:hypothetical protein
LFLDFVIFVRDRKISTQIDLPANYWSDDSCEIVRRYIMMYSMCVPTTYIYMYMYVCMYVHIYIILYTCIIYIMYVCHVWCTHEASHTCTYNIPNILIGWLVWNRTPSTYHSPIYSLQGDRFVLKFVAIWHVIDSWCISIESQAVSSYSRGLKITCNMTLTTIYYYVMLWNVVHIHECTCHTCGMYMFVHTCTTNNIIYMWPHMTSHYILRLYIHTYMYMYKNVLLCLKKYMWLHVLYSSHVLTIIVVPVWYI